MSRDEFALHQARSSGTAAKPRHANEVTRAAFALPFPPTVNHSHAPNRLGGRYLTVESREFRDKVKAICHGQGWPHITGRLRVSMILFPPDKRRFDIDNRCKAVLDALQHAAVFVDDEAVDVLEITRQTTPIAGEGACHVTVSRLP
jgi:crossover junction endodeoxyribonuclease RusA